MSAPRPMTLAQQYAAHALTGILANPEFASMPTERIVAWAAEIGNLMQRKMG